MGPDLGNLDASPELLPELPSHSTAPRLPSVPYPVQAWTWPSLARVTRSLHSQSSIVDTRSNSSSVETSQMLINMLPPMGNAADFHMINERFLGGTFRVSFCIFGCIYSYLALLVGRELVYTSTPLRSSNRVASPLYLETIKRICA
jgi:hypothetical protein